MDIVQILEQNWLSTKEAKVYLSCLSLGQASATTIARKSEEKRLTTYDILKKLHERGIASEVIKNGIREFSVISPQLLVQKKEAENTKALSDLKRVLPLFESLLHSKGTKPIINVYEGFDGLKTMYEDSILSPYQDVIIGKQDMDPRFSEYLYNEFVPRRIAKKMQVRVIYSNQYHHDIVHKNTPEQYREVFVLDHPLFTIGNSIFIHSDTKFSVAMFAGHEMTGFTMQSKIFHDSFKSMFDMLWLAYKPK